MDTGKIIQAVETVIKGKREKIELVLVALLSRGHVLIEDIPGIGKTTLALAFSRATGLNFRRIQFTSDLLPADIIGAVVLDKKSGEFTFRKGPVFTNILLADEINRATPKTQSALLEAMGETQVSVEGITYPLPQPFLVIATQNPVEHYGTFPLPESQLDRFMMRFEMGYPDDQSEREILRDGTLREKARLIKPVTDREEIVEAQKKVEEVRVSDKVIDYIMEIARITRERFLIGMSTRAALDLSRAARALAFIKNRTFVTPDDVKYLARFVIPHRILPRDNPDINTRVSLIDQLLHEVQVPV